MMVKYFIRRFLLMIPTFFGATLVVFVIIQMAPGGPVEQVIMRLKMASLGQGEVAGAGSGDIAGTASLPQEAVEQIRKYFGFDKPIHIRYLRWLGLWPREKESHIVKLGKAVRVPTGEIMADGERVRLWKWVKAVEEGGKARLLESKEQGAGYWVNDEIPILPRVEKVTAWRPCTEFTIVRDWNDEWKGYEEKNGGEKRVEFAKLYRSGILTGDLGESYVYAEPVWDVIRPRFKISLFFGLSGMLLAYGICIPLGIFKALKHGSLFDLSTSFVVFMGYSIPGWALGAILLVLLGGGSFWDVFPLGGFRSPNWETLDFWAKVKDQLHHAVLPMIAWTIQGFAILTVLMKNSLLENLSADYVRTAFAKGLPERRVIWVHVFRNSLIPICVGIGHLISVFLAGSYLIEKTFNIDGFGLLGFTSVLERDYVMIMGILVISVFLTLLGNILSDIALAIVDPRIRFK